MKHPDDVPYKVIRLTNPGMLVCSPLLYLLLSSVKRILWRLAVGYISCIEWIDLSALMHMKSKAKCFYIAMLTGTLVHLAPILV